MGSTFGGIEISKRSLFSHQAALTTTGHNIANSNSKGYTRQTVNLTASRPLEALGLMRTTVPGQNGQGVEFSSITRIREKYLDDQFMNENKSLGQWTIRSDALEKLEKIVNEPSDTGIRQTIEGFWNAWQELTKYPDSRTNRVLLKERTIALTDSLNSTAVKLNELASDLTENIKVRARQVDSILDGVAKFNEEIYRIEGLGNDANDLRDQRDLLVDELSGYINVTVMEDTRGYNINMGSTTLVSGNTKEVEMTQDFLESSFGTNLQNGEVAGMIFSRDQIVASYTENLNAMVRSIVQGKVEITLPANTILPSGVTVTDANGTEFSGTLPNDTTVLINGLNGLHQLGYTLNDTPGEPFFQITEGKEAETIKINPDMIDNVFLIAASNRTFVDEDGNTKTVKGSNEIALLIAGLNNKKFEYKEGQIGSVNDYFRSIIGELGVQGQEAHRQLENQKALVEHIESRRQSVSGVSLDEEMTNMIKFQHAYNAAARAMTAYDEILDKVINGMGVVGR